jgi:hypothetical protein
LESRLFDQSTDVTAEIPVGTVVSISLVNYC